MPGIAKGIYWKAFWSLWVFSKSLLSSHIIIEVILASAMLEVGEKSDPKREFSGDAGSIPGWG